MATGDDAVAAGMAVCSGTVAANTIDTEITLTRDYIAQHKHAATPVNKGGTGSTTASDARTALGITPANIGAATTSHTHAAISSGANSLGWDGTRFSTGATLACGGDLRASGGVYADGGIVAQSYGTSVAGGGGYRSLYVRADGLYGGVTSSRRFKKNISPLEVDLPGVLGLTPVEFEYKASYGGGRDVGLIAEDVEAAGLGWLVTRDAEGQVDGIHYERVAVALLAVIRDQEARITALEQGRP